MKICASQIRSVKGDIPANIRHHIKFVEAAAFHDADLIIFPELSLTGYEPQLAGTLATTSDDRRLAEFQRICDSKNIIIAAGLPFRTESGITISMIIFQPQHERQTYSKKYIHNDEKAFFTAADTNSIMYVKNHKIGLAICYEISVADHAKKAALDGVDLYLASVAKSKNGAENAWQLLAKLADQYKMNTVMANSVGPCDNFESAGMSAVWNKNGRLLGRLDDQNEGLLVFDTEKQTVTVLSL